MGILNAQNISDTYVPLPPLEEQRRIASVLEKADHLRTLRRKTLARLDDLVQSVFLEMFGDPVTNPMGWEVKKLKEITTKIMSGNTPKGGSQVYVSQGITFFRSQNVWRNRIELEDIAYIDQDTHNQMKKSSLKHKDILMTKTGRVNTENSSLGRAAMYLGEDDKANLNGHVYLIRPVKNAINEFILHILTTKQYREYIRSVCVGGIDKRQINKEHLEEFPIIYPPAELQEKFVSIHSKINKKKQIYRKQLIHTEILFNALMQKAFKGELEFKEAERQVEQLALPLEV